jgi:hypothetical protein
MLNHPPHLWSSGRIIAFHKEVNSSDGSDWLGFDSRKMHQFIFLLSYLLMMKVLRRITLVWLRCVAQQ